MSTARISRNDQCPCGSGRKFKHCCYHSFYNGAVPQPRPIPTDGASLSRGPVPPRELPCLPKPIVRVGVSYAIEDEQGKAEVSFCYPIDTRVIMAEGDVLPVEYLRTGMRFRLEDGGTATVTSVDAPKVWEPPSQERDKHGNSCRRVVGTVKYAGYLPRFDLGLPGDVIKTTPGHLFWSENRRGWMPAETFKTGEFLRDRQGRSIRVEWISSIRFEFCELYNVEVEDFHTYFVGDGPHGGIWSHNGMEMGCRVPRAATEEALESGAISQTSRARAGVVKPPDHHIFPQEMRAAFAKRGLADIDRFKVRLSQGVHEALHYKQPTDSLKGGFWNNEFLRRMSAQEAIGGELSRRDILRIGAQMRKQYIFGARLLPVGG